MLLSTRDKTLTSFAGGNAYRHDFDAFLQAIYPVGAFSTMAVWRAGRKSAWMFCAAVGIK